jgi:hypothetical protein
MAPGLVVQVGELEDGIFHIAAEGPMIQDQALQNLVVDLLQPPDLGSLN